MPNVKWCCAAKCFDILAINHVDGLACKICMSWGYCTCKCINKHIDTKNKQNTIENNLCYKKKE